MRQALKILTAVIFLTAVIVLYALVDPTTGFMPRCSFKMLTGYDCPGCGAQRCLHALLHGDFIAAWHFNPAIFVLIPVAMLYAIVELTPFHNARLERWLYSPITIYSLVAALILWWILRNVFFHN